METCMMHLDIDAFFPSVEQARLPFLRGLPVIVGAGVIASCSYEARRLGLSAGMPLHDARRICPQGIFLDGDAQVYKSFAEKAWAICRDFSPAVDTYLDDAYLDMTGTSPLYPDVRTAAAFLKRRVREETGLAITAGVGPGRIVARMASAQGKPDGLCVVEGRDVDAFLCEKPVEALVGVGRKTARALNLLGVDTIGRMRDLPLEGLRRLFGHHPAHYLNPMVQPRISRNLEDGDTSAEFRVRCAVHDAPNTRHDRRTGAHHAWLDCGVDCGIQ